MTTRPLHVCLLALSLASGCSASHHGDGGTNDDASVDRDQGASDLAGADLAGADRAGADLAGDDLAQTTPGPSLSLLAGALGGPGNIDGVGTLARVRSPGHAASDGAGSLYVPDGNAIRKIVLATGAVTTFAGNPSYVPGFTDGVGNAARFANPYGAVADGNGNLFVTDTTNATIRKIVIATATVSTFAGQAGLNGTTDGTGSAARFMGPLGITTDGAGNLYVADGLTVRKIVIATGAVTTLAGSTIGHVDATGTAAQFRRVVGIAYDGSSSLYLADSDSQTIRQLVIATGAVTTIAGKDGVTGSSDGTGSAARFQAPSDLATDGAGNLYVADEFVGLIRKIVIASGVVTTVAGAADSEIVSLDGTGTAARFGGPDAITFVSGTLYISDGLLPTIRKMVAATSVVTTIVGLAFRSDPSTNGTGAAARFRVAIGGITTDGAGNVYTTDGSLVRKTVLATGVVTTIAGTAGSTKAKDGTGTEAAFESPSALAYDGAGDLYVTDGPAGVRKLVLATSAVTTIPQPTPPFVQPVGIACDASGNVYVSDAASFDIRKIVVATGVVTTLAGQHGVTGTKDGVGTAATLEQPNGLGYDGTDTLYFSDANAIRKVALSTGTVTTFAGTSLVAGAVDGTLTAARFASPGGVSFDGAGHLYVGDFENEAVRRIDIAAGMVTTVVGAFGSVGVELGPLPGSLSDVPWVVAIPGGVALGSESAVLVTKGL